MLPALLGAIARRNLPREPKFSAPQQVLIKLAGKSEMLRSQHIPHLFWILATSLFYGLLIALPVIEPDDLLDSELVYNVAIGGIWVGDRSVINAFLVGNVPTLALSRLTQPMMLFYAVFPALPAYILNDLTVRVIAAVGAYFLLREVGVDRTFRHVLAALFSVSLSNTIFGLSIAGLPAVTLLLMRGGRLRLLPILLIGWNSSLYLSGIFFLAAAPILQRYIFGRKLDGHFVVGLTAYFVGLLLGNIGLFWLALLSNERWHREEWGVFQPAYPFPWKIVGRPLLPLFVFAAIIGHPRSRAAATFGVFILVWFLLLNLTFVQEWKNDLPGPLGITAFDRFYFLWPFALLLTVGFATIRLTGWRRKALFFASIAGCVSAATPHEHFRQLARNATGIGTGYPPFEQYYHRAWFRASGLNAGTPVLSIGIDPMSAPMNGVPSIDGYFPLYPLSYKHRFQRVSDSDLIRNWGSKLYASPPINFHAARELGALYVISSSPMLDPALRLISSNELWLYKISGPDGPRTSTMQPFTGAAFRPPATAN